MVLNRETGEMKAYRNKTNDPIKSHISLRNGCPKQEHLTGEGSSMMCIV